MLFNYSWLHAKISAGPIANVLDDFTRALSFVKKPEYKRQVGNDMKMRHTIVDHIFIANSLLGYLEFRFWAFCDPFLDLGLPINF